MNTLSLPAAPCLTRQTLPPPVSFPRTVSDEDAFIHLCLTYFQQSAAEQMDPRAADVHWDIERYLRGKPQKHKEPHEHRTPYTTG